MYLFMEEYFLQLFLSSRDTLEYLRTQAQFFSFFFFLNQESIFGPRWRFILTVPSVISAHWLRSCTYRRNIFFIFFPYLKAGLSRIFVKCPGQGTLALSVSTRRFCITYFMLRCKTVSPRGLRSLRKNEIFVMSVGLSFIKSLFQAGKDVNLGALLP